MRTVTVDYIRYLRSATAETRLFPSEREGLAVGEVVTVAAEDGTPARRAEVTAINGSRVSLKFLESVKDVA